MSAIFGEGLASVELPTLIFSAIAAVLYLYLVNKPVSVRRTSTKVLSIGLLAVLAYVTGGPALLIAALVLSALGDAFLAQRQEEPFFLAGLGSFLIAHVLYIALFISAFSWTEFVSVSHGILAIGMIILAAFALKKLWPVAGKMLPAVCAYTAAILLMGLVSLGVPIDYLFVGAVLFMVSDLTLAGELFLLSPNDSRRRFTTPFVWVTYYGAQVTLTLLILTH